MMALVRGIGPNPAASTVDRLANDLCLSIKFAQNRAYCIATEQVLRRIIIENDRE
jgi:hypothetical protein